MYFTYSIIINYINYINYIKLYKNQVQVFFFYVKMFDREVNKWYILSENSKRGVESYGKRENINYFRHNRAKINNKFALLCFF